MVLGNHTTAMLLQAPSSWELGCRKGLASAAASRTQISSRQRRRPAPLPAAAAASAAAPSSLSTAELAERLVSNIVVTGGGPAGLATAVALQRVGLPAVVLEREPELSTAGTALGLWTNAWRALEALGTVEPLRKQHPEITRWGGSLRTGRLLWSSGRSAQERSVVCLPLQAFPRHSCCACCWAAAGWSSCAAAAGCCGPLAWQSARAAPTNSVACCAPTCWRPWRHSYSLAPCSQAAQWRVWNRLRMAQHCGWATGLRLRGHRQGLCMRCNFAVPCQQWVASAMIPLSQSDPLMLGLPRRLTAWQWLGQMAPRALRRQRWAEGRPATWARLPSGALWLWRYRWRQPGGCFCAWRNPE